MGAHDHCKKPQHLNRQTIARIASRKQEHAVGLPLTTDGMQGRAHQIVRCGTTSRMSPAFPGLPKSSRRLRLHSASRPRINGFGFPCCTTFARNRRNSGTEIPDIQDTHILTLRTSRYQGCPGSPCLQRRPAWSADRLCDLPHQMLRRRMASPPALSRASRSANSPKRSFAGIGSASTNVEPFTVRVRSMLACA